jgi:putative iron-only hydrogenase system regulator
MNLSEKHELSERDRISKHRIGVISIIIYDRCHAAQKINALLSEFGHLIIGRMGIPHQVHHIHIIAIMVEGTNEDIGALSGKLGMIPHVSVKSHVSKWEGDDHAVNDIQESST